MDITALTTLISSVGFPIACCIAMYVQNQKLTENHKEEMLALQNAIDNNTAALQQLQAKIG